MKTILVDAVNTFVINGNDGYNVDQSMFDMLESYPNPKIVVTNAPEEKMDKFNLRNLPYKLFSLHANPRKTNPEYFNILMEKEGLVVEDLIYFEHNKDAVKSAESLGIKSYWFDKEERDLKKLNDFLVLNCS